MDLLSWSDFEKVAIRVATIIDVQDFPEAQKPAFKLILDFGPELGEKKSSAQLTKFYTPAFLLNKQVLAVVNFPPKQIANFISECLVLGLIGETGEVVLVHPDRAVPNGQRLL